MCCSYRVPAQRHVIQLQQVACAEVVPAQVPELAAGCNRCTIGAPHLVIRTSMLEIAIACPLNGPEFIQALLDQKQRQNGAEPAPTLKVTPPVGQPVVPAVIQREPPPVGGPPDLAAQLKQLADLHDSGALDDDDYRRAKDKILGGPAL